MNRESKQVRLQKLIEIRWKAFNLFGWIFGAVAITSYMSVGKKAPVWLLGSLMLMISILIILSLYIMYCKKVINNKEKLKN